MYCGDRNLENDVLFCVCNELDPLDIIIEVHGVKTLNYPSTLCSLVKYGASDCALLAIKRYITIGSQFVWRREIEKRSLWDKFVECVNTGYGIGIFDSVQRDSLTAIRPWANYDMTKFKGNNETIYCEDI